MACQQGSHLKERDWFLKMKCPEVVNFLKLRHQQFIRNVFSINIHFVKIQALYVFWWAFS